MSKEKGEHCQAREGLIEKWLALGAEVLILINSLL